MFGFGKKKRITQYVVAVNRFIDSTYNAGDPTGDVRFSERDSSDIKYSFSGSPENEIKYSSKKTGKTREKYSVDDTEGIPNRGDSFCASTVRTFMLQKSNCGLNSQLDTCLDLTFVDMLIRYINEKGWRDSRVYKAAQMDRRLFSKIMSDRNYRPSKDTVLALVVALELSLKQANDLLSRAGYTLSHSNKRDVIVEYFIREGIFNLSDINEVLYHLDQKIIGR